MMEATSFRWADLGQDNPIQFLTRRKITGEKILVARVQLETGCHVATHQHESEQIAIVLSGHVRWGIGADGSSERREVEMGGGVFFLVQRSTAVSHHHQPSILKLPNDKSIRLQFTSKGFELTLLQGKSAVARAMALSPGEMRQTLVELMPYDANPVKLSHED